MCATLGIPEDRVLAAEVAVRMASSPAKLSTCRPTRARLSALKRGGLARPDAVFGNSIHDLAMLEIAANAFPVNPSPALLEAAAKNGLGLLPPQRCGGYRGRRWPANRLAALRIGVATEPGLSPDQKTARKLVSHQQPLSAITLEVWKTASRTPNPGLPSPPFVLLRPR